MLFCYPLSVQLATGPVVQVQEVPSKSDCYSFQSPVLGHSQAYDIHVLDLCGSLLTITLTPHCPLLLLIVLSFACFTAI